MHQIDKQGQDGGPHSSVPRRERPQGQAHQGPRSRSPAPAHGWVLGTRRAQSLLQHRRGKQTREKRKEKAKELERKAL